MNQTRTPEQWATEGKAAYQRGEYLEAAQAFEAAAKGYSLAGDALSSAEMANNLGVALLKANDASGALKAVEGSDAIFASVGDTRRQAMAKANYGAALEALHRYEEAMTVYEEAASLLKDIGDHELRAPLMQSLARLQMRTGRHLEGIATLHTGLDEMKDRGLKHNVLKKLLRIVLHRLGL